MITAFSDYLLLALSFLCSNESLCLPHLFLDRALRLAFLHVRNACLFLLWVRKPSLPLLDEHNFFLFETPRSFLIGFHPCWTRFGSLSIPISFVIFLLTDDETSVRWI